MDCLRLLKVLRKIKEFRFKVTSTSPKFFWEIHLYHITREQFIHLLTAGLKAVQQTTTADWVQEALNTMRNRNKR